MRQRILAVLFLSMSFASGNASQVVITFEEPSVPTNIPFPEGGEFDAGGLHFGGLGVIWRIPAELDAPIMRVAASPPTAMQIGLEVIQRPTIVTRVGGGTFDFLGATLGCACDTGPIAHVRGYRNGELIYDTSAAYSNYPDVAAQQTFNMLAIDRLELSRSSFSNGNDALDNLTVNVIPIPAAAWLLGPALGMLAAIRRPSVSP